MNVLKICVGYLAFMTCVHLAAILSAFVGYSMKVSVSSAILANVFKIHSSPTTCVPFPLSANYYSYFINLFLGTKVKGGAKRNFKVKRESLPTGTFWDHNTQSRSHTYIRTCTDYDKVALIPNGHLCHI